MHHTTFVLAGIPGEPDAPLLVLGADDPGGIPGLPLVTSLHRIGNEVMAYVHASPLGHPVPVSDAWIAAVGGYGAAAKVVLVLEPLPADIETSYAPIGAGVIGEDLPAWTGDLVAARIRAALRDVPVTSGTGVADLGVVLERPADVAQWAHTMIEP